MDNKLQEKVEMIVSTAEAIVISNNDELKNATEFIKEIKKVKEIVENHYDPMVKSTKAAYDTAKGERDKYLNPLKDMEGKIREIINEYNNRVRMLALAEEARIRKEQEETKKKLEEAQKAVEEGDVEKVQQLMAEAVSTTVEIPTIEQPKNVRKVYDVKVVDISKVPPKIQGVEILELSKEGKKFIIDQYKKYLEQGKKIQVAGLEITEEVTTIIR